MVDCSRNAVPNMQSAKYFIDCLEKTSSVKSNHSENVMFAEFLGYGFVGVVFGWAQRGMKDSPEEMTKRLERIISNLKQIAKDNRR